MRLLIIVLPISVLMCGCTGILCGELENDRQKMLDSANNMYPDEFLIREIPCDFIYAELRLKTERLDSIHVNEVHKVLHSDELKKGWQTLKIYNHRGEYLTSHFYNGKFQYYTGN